MHCPLNKTEKEHAVINNRLQHGKNGADLMKKEKAIDKIIAALGDYISPKTI